MIPYFTVKRTGYLLLCLSFIFIPSIIKAQDGPLDYFDLRDREYLLETLFDSDSINQEGEVLWSPMTYSDRMGSNVSDDGLVHTGLDTILYYTENSQTRAIVVFETLHYENGSISNCLGCGAQLSAAIFQTVGDNVWRPIRFAKHFTTQGTYGLNGESALTQMGEEHWCLRLQMSWTDQGMFGEFVTYYDLETFDKVFNFTLHEDNYGIFEAGSEKAYSFDKAIHFIPNVETESGWWDFDIVMQGTRSADDIERVVPSNEVTRYHLDWETGTYIKLCE